MTWAGIIAGAIITAIIVWLCRENKIPEPFQWVAYAVLIVLWIVALLAVLGYGNFLGQPVGR